LAPFPATASAQGRLIKGGPSLHRPVRLAGGSSHKLGKGQLLLWPVAIEGESVL